MKDLLKYHPNSYFNSTDKFLVYDPSLNKLSVSCAEFNGGSWYACEGLQFKLTSVPTLNFKEIKGIEVGIKGTKLKGKLNKVLQGSTGEFGINWYRGQRDAFKESGFPYFWNNPNTIKLY